MTDDTPKVQPALTPEEWKDKRAGRMDLEYMIGLTGNEAQIIAALNDDMPDTDPRKITRALLDALTAVVGAAVLWQTAERKSGRDMTPLHRDVAAVVRLFDILESLLPPDTP